MSLHNFNSNTKSWKMYTNILTSISGDDLLVMPSYGKDIILEVSANNDIFFKKGTITKRFDNLVSDYLETSFNSLNSRVEYILQEISGNSVKDFITSGISNDLLIKSYDGRDIILEVSGNSEIIFKRGDFSYNLDDLIGGGGSQSSDYATYNILDITGKIIFTDNSGTSGTSGSGTSGGSSNIVLTSISGDIIPSINNTFKLGDVSKNWSNAYITDISATNIDISGNLNVVGATKFSNSLEISGNVTFGGSNLYVPSSFTIDPIGHGDNTGTVTINGNLVVQGVTTTINSSVVDISDKMIVFASKASNSLQADGAGFEISGAKVNFLYNNSSATFRSSIGISISGNVVPVTSTGSLGSSLIPWSNAYIRDVSTTNIEVSGNIVPLRDMSSNLGSSLKRWKNVFVNDLSVNTINGQAYSAGGGTSSYTSITSGTDIGNFNILGAIIPPEGTVDLAGYSVAMNDVGDVIAIGAPRNRGPSNNSPGQVRVYYYNGTSWIQRGLDIDGEGSNNRAGASLSMNSDGTIIAIGAPDNNGANGQYSGHVRVYKWNNTSWIPQGQDIDGELEWDQLSGVGLDYGPSLGVSLNSDGTIVAVGSWGNWQAGIGGAGHVRVYKYTTTWTQIGLDIDGKTYSERSGFSVSLNSDGTLVAIGAPYMRTIFTSGGNVRIYKWTGSIWQQRGMTICGEAIEDMFGSSVSLNAVGDILAFGSFGSSPPGTTGLYYGQVRVYKWINDISWVKQGQSIYGRYYDQRLGVTVALNSVGDIVAIGSSDPYDNNGEVIVYKWNAVSFLWEQYAHILSNLSQGETFGRALALNAAGNRLIVGAMNANVSGQNSAGGYSIVYQYSAGSASLVSSSITPSVNNTYVLGRNNMKWNYGYFSNIITDYITVDYIYSSKNIISCFASLVPTSSNSVDLGTSTRYWQSGRFRNVYATEAFLPGSDNASTIGYSNQRFANIYTMALTVNTTGYTSDDRLKHNEVIINNGLDVIDLLTPKFYQKTIDLLDAHYNGDLSGHKWSYESGLIAQEVLQISDLSFAVSGGDYYDSTNNLITQTYNVNYNSVFVYGLAAIKELHQKVKAQETSISSLQTAMLEQQATINSLLTRLQALEAGAN